MHMNFDAAQIEVDRGHMLKLSNGQGSQLSCRSGVLWITQEGNSADIVLRAGHSLQIASNGLTLIYACKESVLQINATQAAHPAVVRGHRAGPAQRCGYEGAALKLFGWGMR